MKMSTFEEKNQQNYEKQELTPSKVSQFLLKT